MNKQPYGEQLLESWHQLLYDYRVPIDATAYENWDKDTKVEGFQVLMKDLPRTRAKESYMQQPSFQKIVKRMGIFFCLQNNINYQQGLLQVIVPFALLHRKEFPTKKCYAYFNSFMRKFFPKVLMQRIIKNKKQLPHAVLAVNLTSCLLRYHYPHIVHALYHHDIELSVITTQELLTVFARNLDMKLVYQIYAYFMEQNNPNFIFYMCVAMVGMSERQILDAVENDTLFGCLQNIKRIRSGEELWEWFRLTEQIKENTPESFQRTASRMCFANRHILTLEDLHNMLDSQKILNGYLPISIKDIRENPSFYIMLVIDADISNLNCIKITQQSSPNKQQKKKIFVVALTQGEEETELKAIEEWTSKIGKFRIAMLQERLSKVKSTTCMIF